MIFKKKKLIFTGNTSLGLNLASGLGICTFLGFLWDKKHNSFPKGLFVGIFVGMFYGGYEIWKYLRDLDKKK